MKKKEESELQLIQSWLLGPAGKENTKPPGENVYQSPITKTRK